MSGAMSRSPTAVRIVRAELVRSDHADAVLRLLDEYARDPMGGGMPLSAYVRENLIRELDKRESTVVLLAIADDEPRGLLIAFEGFSTFACRPLLNIHDVIVARSHRGRGLSRHLLHAAEQTARQRNCCKLTLEVLSGNSVAQAAYLSFGFSAYQLDPEAGQALFWQKTLD